MALIKTDGFKYLPCVVTQSDAPGAGAALTRVAGRGGRHAVHWDNGDSGTNTGSTAWIDHAFTTGRKFSIGWAANHAGRDAADDAPNAALFFQVGSTWTGQWWTLSANKPVGVAAYTGTALPTVHDNSPTTPGWHWWCLRGTPNQTLGDGFYLYRDGVLVAEQSADNFPSGGFKSVRICMGNAGSTQHYFDVGDYLYYDDEDPIIPDSRVDVIELASTTAVGWTGSDGDQVDNHLLLNDAGPSVDTASYVKAESSGLVDTYTLASLPSALADDVTALGVLIGGGAVDASRAVVPDVDGDAGAEVYPQSGTITTQFWETNPTGAVPWTKTDVQNAEIGLTTQ